MDLAAVDEQEVAEVCALLPCAAKEVRGMPDLQDAVSEVCEIDAVHGREGTEERLVELFSRCGPRVLNFL